MKLFDSLLFLRVRLWWAKKKNHGLERERRNLVAQKEGLNFLLDKNDLDLLWQKKIMRELDSEIAFLEIEKSQVKK
jgi:hypothetical protein